MIVNTRPGGQSVARLFLLRATIAIFLLCAASIAAAAESPHAPADRLKAWTDAKFGIFIHFGPWSQTESGMIWAMVTNKDPQQRQKYFELYRTFNPTRFDADAWAKEAKRSGAKYMVFTTKHHDGFCNFDSKLTDYDIANPVCPYSASPHPDLTAEFVRATRAQNLLTGLYYSHIDWHHPNGNWHHDTVIDESFVHYHPDRWRDFASYEQGQVRELLTNYGPIDLLWFDVSWPRDAANDTRQLLASARSLQPQLVINDRGAGEFADYVTPEQGIPNPIPAGPWETCFTISEGNGFWYKGPTAKYKSTASLIRLLADIVSKGGNLLLNVGPKADGTWPEEESSRLAKIGAWLDHNGAAIYGTTRSNLAKDPEWGRITLKGSTAYAIIFESKAPVIHLAIDRALTNAHLLVGGQKIAMEKSADGSGWDLHYTMPATETLPVVIELK